MKIKVIPFITNIKGTCSCMVGLYNHSKEDCTVECVSIKDGKVFKTFTEMVPSQCDIGLTQDDFGRGVITLQIKAPDSIMVVVQLIKDGFGFAPLSVFEANSLEE